MPQGNDSSNGPKNFDELVTVLDGLQPRGTRYRITFQRPPDNEMPSAMHNAVRRLEEFEGEQDDRKVTRFVIDIGRDGQTVLGEACAVWKLQNSIRSQLEKAYGQLVDNPKGSNAWEEARDAINRYKDMCDELTEFMQMLENRAQDEQLKRILIEYERAIMRMPSEVRDSSPDYQEGSED